MEVKVHLALFWFSECHFVCLVIVSLLLFFILLIFRGSVFNFEVQIDCVMKVWIFPFHELILLLKKA